MTECHGWDLYYEEFNRARYDEFESEDDAHCAAYTAVRDSYGRYRTEADREVLDELNR